MVKGLIDENNLINIADAIREKTGENSVYYPSEMADKILSIQTGGGGLELTTSLVLTSNVTKTTGNVVLTTVLKADYDTVDTDLHGFLSNATVKLYDSSNTLVNTGVTNDNGVVVFNETITEDTTFYAKFDGTSDYNSCISNEVTVEVINYFFYDKCDSATTLTNYGSSETMRNNGISTIGHTDDYHTITNNRRDAESMIPILPLTGLSDDFSIEFDSYIQGSNGSSGFVIYNDSNNWCKLTDDGNKKYWIGYNINGSFTEQGFSDSGTNVQEWIHSKFTIQDGIFKAELSRDDVVFYTKQYTLPNGFNITSSTRFGLDSEWQPNTVTRYKNIKVVSLSGE